MKWLSILGYFLGHSCSIQDKFVQAWLHPSKIPTSSLPFSDILSACEKIVILALGFTKDQIVLVDS